MAAAARLDRRLLVDRRDVSDNRHGGDQPATRRGPWVMLNMIASVDGAASVGGLSGGLSSGLSEGSNPDTQMLVALRREADVLLVGRRTIESERYRRPTAPLRSDASATPRVGPRLAVVSASGAVDLSAPAFAPSAGEGDPPPLLLCHHSAVLSAEVADQVEVLRVDALVSGDSEGDEPDSHRGGATHSVAGDLGSGSAGGTGSTQLDMASALEQLHGAGARVVLCEGGPTLNGSLLAAGLVDEMNLTVAPLLVGGGAGRIVQGGQHGSFSTSVPEQLALQQVVTADGLLFLRYVRRDP